MGGVDRGPSNSMQMEKGEGIEDTGSTNLEHAANENESLDSYRFA